MIPEAYRLKRHVREKRAKFWRGDCLGGVLAAPIYVFGDQERFDSDEVGRLVRDFRSAEPKLPHPTVIFEIGDRSIRFHSHLIYARQTTEGVEAFYFVQDRTSKRWTDVVAHARFALNETVEVEAHPRIATPLEWKVYAEVLASAVWRAVAILAEAGTRIEKTVSKLHRPKLARAGIRGWTWHQVEIVPERLVRTAEAQGGSHARPRWHIRRGHWRQLADGRRVFVRACEVGDPARGGVLKDYTVGERAA